MELFADFVNEYGMMDAVFTADVEDVSFCFIGNWNKSKGEISGGGGNPQFNRDFLGKQSQML